MVPLVIDKNVRELKCFQSETINLYFECLVSE